MHILHYISSGTILVPLFLAYLFSLRHRRFLCSFLKIRTINFEKIVAELKATVVVEATLSIKHRI